MAQPLPPQLTGFAAANGNFWLSVNNNTNVVTVIQATTNLLSPNSWVNIYTGTSPFTANLGALTNYPSRFYRAVIGQ